MDNSDPTVGGEFIHAVDGKGRVAVPSPFRRKLGIGPGDILVLALGRHSSIEVWTPAAYAAQYAKFIGKTSPYDPKAHQVKLVMMSKKHEVELDGQGRVLLPKALKDRAGITTEAAILGAGESFELWEPGRWRKFEASVIANIDSDLSDLDRNGMVRSSEAVPEANEKDGQVRGDVPRTGDGR